MGLFKDRKSSKKITDNNFLRIQVAAIRTGSSDDNMKQIASVVNIRREVAFNEFIKILIQNFCPKAAEKGATWILVYREKSLAVFNSGSGNINIINDKFINITMNELIGDNNAPQIFLYYIGEGAIEETAKTMLGR